MFKSTERLEWYLFWCIAIALTLVAALMTSCVTEKRCTPRQLRELEEERAIFEKQKIHRPQRDYSNKARLVVK